MSLTPEEERRLEEEFARAQEESRRAGERDSLRRLIARRARKLLRDDFAEAQGILSGLGIAATIGRLAVMLLPSVVERWKERMTPLLEDIAETVTEPKEEILGVGFDRRNPVMEDFLEGYVSELANTVSDTTYRQVMEVLREAEREGLSTPRTAERIRERSDIESERRSKLIARTELHRISIGAGYQQALESDVISDKTWKTSRDEKVRDEHRSLEGVTVPIASVFPNGLPYPMEINCRCTLEYGVDWDALEDSDPERFAGVSDRGGEGDSGSGFGGGGGSGGDGPLGPDDRGGPNHEWFRRGYIDPDKFETYLFEPTHPENQGKAEGWRRVFELSRGDAEEAMRRIREQLDRAEIVERPARGPYKRWELVIPDFEGLSGNRAELLTAWALDPANEYPHLSTSYPRT